MKNVSPILFYCFAGVRLFYRPFAQQNSKFGLPLLVFIFQICYATGLHATTAPVSNFILPDGTLNKPALSGQSLSLNSAGWNVTLDPTRGPVFAPAPPPGAEFAALNKGLNGTVVAIAVSGTDVYVGGVFTGVGSGGTPVSGLNNIAKWNGTSWSALGTGLNGNVTSIAISGSDVYVGGAFTDVGGGGTSVPGLNRIAKWNGTGWSALDRGLNNFVRAIALSGTDVYVVGGFTDVGSGTAVAGLNKVAKWNSINEKWSSLDNGVNSFAPVAALAVSNTDVYVGGSFGGVSNGGVPVPATRNIAKWNIASGIWSALGTGIDDPENEVRAIAVLGTDVYVGGTFDGGIPVYSSPNIVRWNGSTWSALDKGLNRFVNSITISGTDVYVGGPFTDVGYGGTPIAGLNRIAKWNPASSTWSAFDNGLNDDVYAIAVAGTDVYAGGRFTDIGGGTSIAGLNNIAKWQVPCVPLVSIAVSPSNIITAGTSVTFTATPTLGGTSPTYQWKKNTIDINGETNATYTTTTLANNDVISCIMTGNEACASSVTATSNDITMTVTACTPPTTPTIGTITQPTCSVAMGSVVLNDLPASGTWTINPGNITSSGTTTTISGLVTNNYNFTVTNSAGCTSNISANVGINAQPALPTSAVSGGGNICAGGTLPDVSIALTGAYPWSITYSNGTTSTTVLGIMTSPYIITNASVGNYTVTAISDANCTGTSMTGSALVTVYAPSIGGSIAGSTSVCEEGNSTILTLSGHTGTILRWESSTDNFSSTPTTIANTTTTYTATNLNYGYYSYRAVIQNGICPAVNSATASVTVDVSSRAGVITGMMPVCTGTNSTILNIIGGVGAVIRWESSTDNFASAATTIANTTTTYTATNLTTTTYYRAIVKNNSCPEANSTKVTVTVDAASVGGTISGVTAVCSGINSAALTLSNHTGTILRWESSEDNFASTPTTIANTTTTYTAANLTTTTYYRAVIQNGSCTAVTSATATVTVNAIPTATIVSNNSPICAGSNAIFTVNGTNGATLAYTLTGLGGLQTLVLTGNNQTITASATSINVVLVFVHVSKNGCTNDFSNVEPSSLVTVIPLPTATIISNSSPICSGNNATFTVNGTNGATLTYTLTGQAGLQTLALNGSNQTISANGASDNVTLTLVNVKIGDCSPVTLTETSMVTVNPVPTAAVVSNNSPICAGGNAVFTVNGTNGATLTYGFSQQSQTLFLNGSNQTLTVGGVTTHTPLFLINVTKNGCPVSLLNSQTTPTPNSTVTVNPIPTATVLNNNSAICAGNNAIFTVNGTNGATLTYTLTGQVGNQTLALNGTNQAIIANAVLTNTTLALVSVSTVHCSADLIATSIVTVNPLVTPLVSITANPSGTISTGTGVTFMATPTHGGTLPMYQWKKNTIDINGETNATYTTTTLTNNDVISCIMVSNEACISSATATGNNITVTVTACFTPTSYSLTGGGSYCVGGSGVAVGLANSQVGVNYQLQIGGVNTGSPVAGNGSSISFGNQTVAGIYTIVASNGICTATMIGNASVGINPLPTAGLSGTTTVCMNAHSPNITFTGGSGVAPYRFTYKINGGNNQTVSTNDGNSIIVAAPTNISGVFVYTLVSVQDANNCNQAQMLTATVFVNTKPAITLNVNGQTFNEGNNSVLCDIDANPTNSLLFAIVTGCMSGSVQWRTQMGTGPWSEWSNAAPSTQPSNNAAYHYQAACGEPCPTTITNPITLTIDYRASTPQNVSLVADGTTILAGESKTVCNQAGNTIAFNATCGVGEVLLYSVDGNDYSTIIPSQLIDGNFHNYRVRCRKAEGNPSCVETESSVMSLKISTTPPTPTVSITPTTGCGTPTEFSGSSTCGALTTLWYNAATNQALPTLPTTTPIATASYYARCQNIGSAGEAGCLSEKSNVVTFTIVPVNQAPVVTVSSDLVCAGVKVTVSTTCPVGSSVLWNTGVTESSFQVAFNNVTKASYSAKCVAGNGCQSPASVVKTVMWKGFDLTFINVGQSKSATKPNSKDAWSSQFIAPDSGPGLDYSTEANPTIYFSENVNKTAPRFWTIHVETCNLGTSGSLTFNMLATPELGLVRSYNTHENNAPYLMYANREGFTELYAQNHPAYGFYQNNGNGGNVYDEGLPKGLFKLGVRYWDQKGQGSIYPSTRQPQGTVLAYQEYWFRIQSKNGVGSGAARGSGLSLTVDNSAFAQVMPNPMLNILSLNVSDSKGQKVTIHLLDAAGRTVLQRDFTTETNRHQEEFEVGGLANGIYFLRVNTGYKQTTLKVVKVQ